MKAVFQVGSTERWSSEANRNGERQKAVVYTEKLCGCLCASHAFTSSLKRNVRKEPSIVYICVCSSPVMRYIYRIQHKIFYLC